MHTTTTDTISCTTQIVNCFNNYDNCKYRQLAQLYKDMALTSSSGTTASTANTKGLLQLGGLAGILKNLVPGSAGGKKQKHLKKVKTE
jgi:hypothetical protein